MSKLHREINGLDKAGSADLRSRPLNPKQKSGNMKGSGDLKPNKSYPSPSLKSRSLNYKNSK